ncbi:MAG: InlB B-repeat-containing protein, partial [Clostridia bacterium]|nr:InlB B-repeat-containing protein [Clostridia bacterium]
MNKKLLIKLFCLAVACLLLLPLVMACGDDENNNQNGESEEETVIVTFNPRGGDIISGKDEIQILKSARLSESKLPEVEKLGYVFKYWAYDTKGEDQWYPEDKIKADTDLYAIWDEKTNGGNNDGGNDNVTDGGDDTQGGGTTEEKITIEYNTGSGKLEDINGYEVEIKKDSRYDSHPTPVNDNPAMKFQGWYLDAAFENQLSASYKFTESVMLYAKWIEVPQCSDLTYNHIFTGGWTDGKAATCAEPATIERYCDECGYKEEMPNGNKLGHQWNQWEEAFMRKERSCGRPACNEKEILDYKNVTNDVLGEKPSNQIESTGDGTFYEVNPFTTLFNNNWDEEWTASIIPHGNGDAELTVTFANKMALDRIYLKGVNGGTVQIAVLYEGDSAYTSVGSCSFLSDAEDQKPKNDRLVPYVEPDPTRVIVSVKFIQEAPPKGTSRWQEIAFVTLDVEEE